MNRQLPIILFLTFLVTSLISCQIRLLPSYNKELATEISSIGKAVDKFYLKMLTKDMETNDRDYKNYEPDYVDIQADLNALFEKNRVRPLNKNSTEIARHTMEIWTDYTKDHKDRIKLSDGLIKLNNRTIADLLYAMQVAEKSKQ